MKQWMTFWGRRRLGMAMMAVAVLLLAVGGPRVFSQGSRLVTAQGALLGSGEGFTYQGQLKSDGSVVNGLCDFTFSLWEGPEAEEPLGGGQEVLGQPVSDGLFTVVLNENEEFGYRPFREAGRWLEVAARCPSGGGAYTVLSPRQPLTAVPYAQSLVLPASSHADVLGAALEIQNNRPGSGGSGIHSLIAGTTGTAVNGWAFSTSGLTYGVYGQSDSSSGTGVHGRAHSLTGSTTGVAGESLSLNGTAVSATASGGGVAMRALSNSAGVSRPTLHVQNQHSNGIGIFASQESNDAVMVLTNTGTGDFIRAFGTATAGNLRFRVTQEGNVFADGGYNCGNSINDDNGSGDLSESEIEPCLRDDAPADFAEMLPAVGGLEAGDVLVMGADGLLRRSQAAYAATVMGVYSTRPSYLGNSRFAGAAGYAPLAVVGVVPVKASAENGAIQPGDLLTTASIPGHAMRCQGVELCFGRTIGKALAGLEKETGLILMLVILH